MTEPHPIPSFYWFNAATGKLILSEDQLPLKKSQLYLVFNRQHLFFGMFPLNIKKWIKVGHILNIQRHFVPFKDDDYIDIVYSTEKQKKTDQRFFFWVGRSSTDIKVESFYYDEIPESLIFKGNPEQIKNYLFFVFKRVGGFEAIYFDPANGDFYSAFTAEEKEIAGKILLLARKFGLNRELNILSEVPIRMGDRVPPDFNVDIQSRDERPFFLPDYFPISKTFSNISQGKKLTSIKNIVRLWSRNLDIVIFLLCLFLAANIIAFGVLKKDNRVFGEKFEAVSRVLSESERVRFRVDRIDKKMSQYPDHMLYLYTIARCMNADSMLIGFSIGEGKIILEGYSSDSLDLLTRLRKSGKFAEVRFKTTVIANAYNGKEKFEIEILLNSKEPGVLR